MLTSELHPIAPTTTLRIAATLILDHLVKDLMHNLLSVAKRHLWQPMRF